MFDRVEGLACTAGQCGHVVAEFLEGELGLAHDLAQRRFAFLELRVEGFEKSTLLFLEAQHRLRDALVQGERLVLQLA